VICFAPHFYEFGLMKEFGMVMGICEEWIEERGKQDFGGHK